MSIATSIEKLSETLTNCKTNLKEKGVEADNIKISDVDEKITEIQAGGGFDEINSLLKSVNYDRDTCMVLAKGFYNPNDNSCELSDLKYGENLSNNDIPINYFIKIYNGVPANLYIGIFSCHMVKVEFKEKQNTDYDTYYATTDEVDVSKPGIVIAEMNESY